MGPWRDVKAYGAIGDGVADDRAAIQAAIDEVDPDLQQISATQRPKGALIYFPPGHYRITSPLILKSGIRLMGSSREGSVIRATGVAFEWTSLIRDVNISDLGIKSSGGHLFNIGNNAGIQSSVISRCTMVIGAPGKRIWNQVGDVTYYLFNVVEHCEFWQTADCTTSAWYLKDKSGNLNCNTWRECVLYGNNSPSGPFFHIENESKDNYAYDNSFINIASEQNKHGVLRALTCSNLIIQNLNIWDASADVANGPNVWHNDILYIGGRMPLSTTPPTYTLASRAVTIIGYGRRGGILLNDRYDINTPQDLVTDVTLVGCNHSSVQLALNVTARGSINALQASSPIAASGFNIRENYGFARMGIATLVGGIKTVQTSAINNTSRVFITSQSDGGTPGFLRVAARVPGTSFTIRSSSTSDTSTVAWAIFEPF